MKELKQLIRHLSIAAGACAALAAPAEAQPSGETIVFEGATVIVGDGSPPLEDAVLVVEGTRFAAVGRAGEVDIPAGAARVDLGGKTVMPAIVDTHTHLGVERDALVQDLRRRARFGVGAAMSLGMDSGDVPFAVRGEEIPGAALYRTAGRGITTPEPGRSEVPHWVTTEEEARAAVREEAALGADIIKIWVDDRNGQYQKLSPELYTAIIDEAHRNDLRVTAHIFYLEDAKALLRAGIDAFAHGIRDTDVDDEAVALFRERPEVVLVPNLPDRGVAADMSWLRGQIPGDELRRVQDAATERPEAQQAFAIQARNLDRLASEGVRIALGTDGNTPWAAHVEMADMVAAGMSPADVIVAATRNSAEFLGLDDRGTIEQGNSADFIVLDGNPLEDITNTRRIADVYLRGAVVDRDGSS
ncbi:MAG: amidohydrolase family protein [Gammaproteobacteria bacterium]|nr:amidohydrolase family protein [Gammaproteobacteria bacterium]